MSAKNQRAVTWWFASGVEGQSEPLSKDVAEGVVAELAEKYPGVLFSLAAVTD